MNKHLVSLFAAMLCGSCASSASDAPAAQPAAPTPLVPHLCDAVKPGVYAAKPFSNKTKGRSTSGGPRTS
jgi:hypothetical protein